MNRNNMDDGGEEETEPEVDTEADPGGVAVDVPEAETVPPPSDEMFNLVPSYKGSPKGRAFLTELGARVVSDVDDDWRSAEDYRATRAVQHKLFTGNIDPKEEPFEDCANVHFPHMLEGMLRLHARGFDQIFPSDGNIIGVIPTSGTGQDRADRLTLHGNYQLRSEMRDFIPNQDKALMECWLTGSVFVHSYRDRTKGRNCHDYLTCMDFVMPYLWRTTDPSLGDVPRKTRILRKYRHDLEADARDGYYDGIEEILETDGSMQDDKDNLVRDAVDDAEGRTPSLDDKQAPYELYEYHGYTTLPGEDHERPVIVTVHKDSSTVIGLSVREEKDWKDQARFDEEMQAFEKYQADQAAYADHVDNQQVLTTLLADPALDPVQRQQFQEQMSQPGPEAPQAVEPPRPVRVVPIESFTHSICIPNPLGSYGLGIGYLTQGFNETADTVASQFIDSATLANVKAMAVSKFAKMETGDIRLGPGSTIVLNVPPEQLAGSFKLIEWPAANAQLMEVAQAMGAATQGVTSAPDVFSGEPGKANETWRGIATRVEQATKQLTVLVRRYLLGLTEILKKNARLNSKFLPESSYIAVVDPMHGAQQIPIARDDYREDYDIQFTADTRMVSQVQQVTEADEILKMALEIPPLAQNPAFLYKALVGALKARRRLDLVQVLGPPPGPPQPPQPKPVWEEDAGFLRSQDSPVLPDDNDSEHILGHTTFLGTVEGAALAKEDRDKVERHVRFHLAQRLEKQMKEMGSNGQSPAGLFPGGPGGLAPPPGHGGVSPGPVPRAGGQA